MSVGTVPPLLTVGAIAARLGVPVHRIVYVVESRGIRAAGRAGNVRVFSDADVAYIKSELQRIAEEKSGNGGLL